MRLYNVDCDYRIEDFLINKQKYAALCRANPTTLNPYSKESMIIIRSDDEIYIAIYIDPEIIKNLAKIDLNKFRLTEENIQDLCIAIEGVSHFLYFFVHAISKVELSRFELELQAEIDKFVILTLCLIGDCDNPLHGTIISRLFDRYTFLMGLKPEAKEIYRDASRMAARYCYSLRNRYIHPLLSGRELLDEVRDFYMLNHWSKISHIGI